MNRTIRPMHPGIAFNELVLAPLGRSTEYAAKAMGVCQSYLESVLSGDILVTRDLAEKMDEFANTPADSWMSIQTMLDEWERDLVWSEFRPTNNRSISGNVHYAELHDGTLDKKAIKKVNDTLGGKKKSWLRRLFSRK